MSSRLAATALVAAALGVTSLGIARQTPPGAPAGGRTPFAQQPPDRGRGENPFAAARATPGRYAITPVGGTTFLLDTGTGDTWALDADKDGRVWRPVRRDHGPPPPPAKDTPPPPKDRPGKAGVEALGTVRPARTVTVAPPADGEVTRVLVQEGDEVKQGDVLAELDRAGDGARVTAPAAGTVMSVGAQVGDRTGFRSRGLFTLADLRDLEATVEVAEADAAGLAKGRGCRVRPVAGPGAEYPGSVSAVSPTVSREAGTVRVRVKVALPADAPPLRSGSQVRVTFQTE
jgi:multidrug efflux pump subunit AcrA (membrane-fusion protein)